MSLTFATGAQVHPLDEEADGPRDEIVGGEYTSPTRDACRHPIMRSAEPGEDWNWYYVDQVAFALAGG